MRTVLHSLTIALLFWAWPGWATVIVSGLETGDFTLNTPDDVEDDPTTSFIVQGTADITSGGTISLARFIPPPTFIFNDFSGAPNQFNGNIIVIHDFNAIRGSFTAPLGVDVVARGTIIVDLLDTDAPAVITAQDGTNFFDIVFRDAQNLHVGGTLTVAAENILFEFTDGLPPSLERLDVGALELFGIGADSTTDTTVLSNEAVVLVDASVPLPETSALFLFGVGLVGLGFMRRRKGA